MDKDPASDGFMPFKVSPLKTWFTADQMQAYAEAYAREALAAQAATLEAICKIIECAGPEAADEIADLLGYPSVEWPSDQALTAPNLACKSAQARLATQWGYVRAASVEPHIPADVEASGWCEYVAGMVGHWVRSDEYAGIKADEDRCTKAIAGIIERRLWALKHSPQPQAVVASSPAQAVDAVPYATLQEVDRFFSGRLAELGSLSGEATDLHAYVRAALQASHQPQPQQAVAEGAGDGLRQTLIDVGRVIAWQCFGDCRAYDEFGPGSLRGLHEMDAEIRAALATPQPEPEWSPAYTRGPARQSAPVAAVPALVPLSVLQYNQIPELCQIRPSLYESVVRAIEAAIAKINGLTVGDGGEG